MTPRPALIGTQALYVRIAGGQYRLVLRMALGTVGPTIGGRRGRCLGCGRAAGQ